MYGRLRLDALMPPLFWLFELKLGCPRTTSAALPFMLGIEFQMSTRWLPPSATKTCVPSLCGVARPSMLLAETPPVFGVAVARSGWPSARSAGCCVQVGSALHIVTRLAHCSPTSRWVPSLWSPLGAHRLLAVVVPPN